jgi:hypothetical protein
MNFIQIANETGISVAYLFSGLFYFEPRIHMLTHTWIVLSCVYFSYILHLSVIGIKFILFIRNKIRTRSGQL